MTASLGDYGKGVSLSLFGLLLSFSVVNAESQTSQWDYSQNSIASPQVLINLSVFLSPLSLVYVSYVWYMGVRVCGTCVCRCMCTWMWLLEVYTQAP